MGIVYKRSGSRNYMMAVNIAGKQICRSTREKTKGKAKKKLSKWERHLSGHPKTGQRWSGQNRPTEEAGD